VPRVARKHELVVIALGGEYLRHFDHALISYRVREVLAALQTVSARPLVLRQVPLRNTEKSGAETVTVPAGKFSPDQIRQFAQAAQNDPIVKGYRSFANLAEGTILCVMEAPGKEAVAAWFKKMGMPRAHLSF